MYEFCFYALCHPRYSTNLVRISHTVNTVPIIFAIDDNVVMQCGVTITSLLMNANEDTFYEIFILCENDSLPSQSRMVIEKAFEENSHAKIAFIDVGNAYSDVPKMERITKATYYRLLIPSLFPQYDKVVYSDIDIIFQQDLSDLLKTSFPNKELVAAVLDLGINREFYFKSKLPESIGKSVEDYFNAGFLVMNLKQLREENKVEEFNKLSKNKYPQNDQDVLNIVCNGRVQWLPSMFNFQTNHYSNYMWGRKNSNIDFNDLVKHATLHYTFHNKPWNSLDCTLADAWWHYYRQSPFFDNNFYFNRQYEQIESYRNDFRQKSNSQLFRRILVNIKHSLFK